MKKRINWNKQKLWRLRQEIVLNSLYLRDYENTFGIPHYIVCDFFDGYMEYLEEINETDTPENLWSWYNCFESDPLEWEETDETYKAVRELNRDELDELKTTYFYSDDYDEKIVNAAGLPVLFPGDIPDEIIFAVYDGISFVKDDFFCNLED